MLDLIIFKYYAKFFIIIFIYIKFQYRQNGWTHAKDAQKLPNPQMRTHTAAKM